MGCSGLSPTFGWLWGYPSSSSPGVGFRGCRRRWWWGAEGGPGDAGGFQALLGCREVLLPSSLAHPTTFLLLLLSPVLNSVAMATMSTTFQLPRDGLRRGGGEREARGRGGLGALLGAGEGGGDASQMVFSCWILSGEWGPCQPSVCQRARGSRPGEGAPSQPPNSEWVGGHPQNPLPFFSHPAHPTALQAPGISVTTQPGGG